MKIVSIEPTPSPNVMKLNLDEQLPAETSYNFNQKNKEAAPPYIQQLLSIEGVQGVFQVSDFISLERHPKADWQEVLALARKVLGDADSAVSVPADSGQEPQDVAKDSFGEVTVYIQKLRDIPMQIKLVKDGEEVRVGLPERFKEAVMKAQTATSNLILERRWEEQTPRYGDLKDVGEQVMEEICAAYDEKRLQQLVERVLAEGEEIEPKKQAISAETVREAFREKEWERRYAAFEQWEPSEEHLDILDQALRDEKAAIRRLAVVYLGFIGGKKVLPYLYRALKDASSIVRRTAGDTLSDLGDPEAIPAMCEALKDPNKLVRWRAARFLYEVGDETALDALRQAENEPEFEVRMQIQMALERIEKGEEASGTVWQQMTRGLRENKE
ncbi:conserved virulence factor C family protein [Thermoflavimicrobium dichotomicum]|uniref:HEAT repeat-containing protein n=1 Tax=Thermoflavimicrobium dichotomicum TaxID=46223 RepID=A0A1I3QEV0_9BACL|nr:conserved virulence factor C family protein [Thermoflavimicrobium dichotomicum]SFJ31666.1 HEAT repeat-containing protein [Thermoflavimicrobium dichotomicum]